MVSHVKLTDIETGWSFEFPINPSKCVATSINKIARYKMPGRDGDVKQKLGLGDKSILITGTLYSGRSYLKQRKYTLQELRQKVQELLDRKAVLQFSGILVNYIGSMQVIAGDNATITFNAGKKNSFTYSITLEEWRAYNVDQITLLGNTNLVGKEALEQFKYALRKQRYRRGT